MGIWETLGIEQTRDTSAIKKAYAEKARLHHPEDDPGGFAALRQAYKIAMALARREPSAVGMWPEDEAVVMPDGAETEAPEPAPAQRDYAFDALEGQLEKDRQQQDARMDAFFEAAEDIYDDTLTRYSLADWRELFSSPEVAALAGSAEFVGRFVDTFTEYDLPEDVENRILLPFVREWRSRWLGTPQWAMFSRIEDPAVRIKQEEHARADDFIRQLDAVYQSKKTRGDPAAWRAVFALPQFDELQGDSYFNRVFARFIMNRTGIPRNIWDEVLTPLMDNWRAMSEGHPLWMSFAWAAQASRKKENRFMRFMKKRGIIVMTMVSIIILVFITLDLVRRERDGVPLTAPTNPGAAQVDENTTMADILDLSYEDWVSLSDEEEAQRSVIGAIGGGQPYHTVADAAEALGITVDDYDDIIRVATEEEAAGMSARVKSFHPASAEIIRAKVMPRIRAAIVGSGARYDQNHWLYYSVGLFGDAFADLRAGWEENGDAWLDEQLAQYDGFFMTVTMMQMPLPDLDETSQPAA